MTRRVDGLADRLYIRGDATGGFRMHHQDRAVCADRIGPQTVFDLVWVNGMPPIIVNSVDRDAQLFRHGSPGERKQAGFRHQDLVARRKYI